MNNTYRRFSAYLIDLVILGLVFMFLYYFLPENHTVQNLNHELAIMNEQVLKEEITYSTYFDQFSRITYTLDRSQALYSGINILLICFYFVVIPLLNKGRTLGLYILGLKIKPLKGNLSVGKLMIRNLVANGLFYMLFSLVSVYLLNYKIYFIGITIFGFIQLLLVIISCFMILYKKDKKGLQDIYSDTEIVKEVLK